MTDIVVISQASQAQILSSPAQSTIALDGGGGSAAATAFLLIRLTGTVASPQTIIQTGFVEVNNIGMGAVMAAAALPKAVLNSEIEAYCLDPGGIRLVPNGADVIRVYNVPCSIGGWYQSTDPGAWLKLRCRETGIWSSAPAYGAWDFA